MRPKMPPRAFEQGIKEDRAGNPVSCLFFLFVEVILGQKGVGVSIYIIICDPSHICQKTRVISYGFFVGHASDFFAEHDAKDLDS